MDQLFQILIDPTEHTARFMERERFCQFGSSFDAKQDVGDEFKGGKFFLGSGCFVEDGIEADDHAFDQIHRQHGNGFAVEYLRDADGHAGPFREPVCAQDVSHRRWTTPNGVLEVDVREVSIQDLHHGCRYCYHILAELTEVSTVQWTADVGVV